MKVAVFHPDAVAELDTAVAFDEARRQGVGLDFQAEVSHAVDFISRHPAAGTPTRPTGVRKRVVRRYPYTVFYLEHDHVVEILAVAHQKRKPGYWENRLP